MGFATTFRFGNPFFLAPNVDELVKRFQLKDNFSIVTGRHTIKTGGEWLHTNNVQVFRGFFEGRYIFDSVHRFPALCVAGGARRVRTVHGGLLERHVCDGAGGLPCRDDGDRRSAPVLSPEQQPGRHRARRGRANRTSATRSSRCSSRTSGRWAAG